MGKNNKTRRAAKAKARAKNRAQPTAGGGSAWSPGSGSTRVPRGEDPSFDPVEVAALMWRLAAQRRGKPAAEEFLDRLRHGDDEPVLAGAESLFLEHLGFVWAGGWQPAELRRQGRLGCDSATAARLVALVIAVDHARRRAATMDLRWISQVEELDLPVTNGRPGWLGRWTRIENLDRSRLIEVVLDAMDNLIHLPRLEPLIPPPGSAPRVQDARGGTVHPVLARIRNLLAKAESTTFEAEATSLTAKVQELITRHAIDDALLADGPVEQRAPVEIRLPVDAPYADAKSLLLQTVAGASRCRAVFSPRVALSTVVGYRDDVAAVELLFTSLLVQAQRAMRESSSRAAPGARTRTQSYRSAFLVAYTQRIGQRMREINEEVTAAARSEQGSRFLPVLSARADSLDTYMRERFGELTEGAVRAGYDSAGWAGGRIAADNAQLTFGDLEQPLSPP